jgi:hypothetical protein
MGLSLDALEYIQNRALRKQREYIIRFIREEFAKQDCDIGDLIDRIRGYGEDPDWKDR